MSEITEKHFEAAWAIIRQSRYPIWPAEAPQLIAAALATAEAEAAELRAELAEQARLVGMGAERELALRAEVDRLRGALTAIAAYDDASANEHLRVCGSYGYFDEPYAVKAARDALTGGTPHE